MEEDTARATEEAPCPVDAVARLGEGVGFRRFYPWASVRPAPRDPRTVGRALLVRRHERDDPEDYEAEVDEPEEAPADDAHPRVDLPLAVRLTVGRLDAEDAEDDRHGAEHGAEQRDECEDPAVVGDERLAVPRNEPAEDRRWRLSVGAGPGLRRRDVRVRRKLRLFIDRARPVLCVSRLEAHVAAAAAEVTWIAHRIFLTRAGHSLLARRARALVPGLWRRSGSGVGGPRRRRFLWGWRGVSGPQALLARPRAAAQARTARGATARLGEVPALDAHIEPTCVARIGARARAGASRVTRSRGGKGAPAEALARNGTAALARRFCRATRLPWLSASLALRDASDGEADIARVARRPAAWCPRVAARDAGAGNAPEPGGVALVARAAGKPSGAAATRRRIRSGLSVARRRVLGVSRPVRGKALTVAVRSGVAYRRDARGSAARLGERDSEHDTPAGKLPTYRCGAHWVSPIGMIIAETDRVRHEE